MLNSRLLQSRICQGVEGSVAVQSAARDIGQRIVGNVNKVIVGKDQAVQQAVIALLSRGHILIEDVPGVGKTMLAKSMARSTRCTFKRIQFTPDLLPSDITGVSIFNQKVGEFEFRPGPVVAQVVLADEINRATPKTQSALLEAMEERQVTVDGVTRPLPRPFIVMATQNPIEYEGTFPLPEAQLDRFMLRITLGYPSLADEMTIMERQQLAHPIDSLEPAVTPEELIQAQEEVKQVYVDSLVKQYIVALVEATRKHSDVALGASPRASLALFRTSQALALLRGRDYILPDDVKEMAEAVIAHRLIVGPAARMRGNDGRRITGSILETVPVPGARAKGWSPS
ncbi:MAG: MoxR family ATPase [Chloroflexi bacterium]|nr:MoxR family ATPase [Chloroflexota bacterium]